MRSCLVVPFALAVVSACGSSSKSSVSGDAGATPDVAVFIPEDGATGHPDAHVSTGTDAATDSPTLTDGSTMTEDSGAPMRNSACTPTTAETGTAVNTSYGRLDGTLVYVVDVGQGRQCNGDDSHVHLQIEVSGSIYDVAVDIGTAPNDEVGMYEETITVPGGVWAEGWHGADALAYTAPPLDLHDTSFVTMAPDAIASEVESLVAGVSKISIFCHGYAQGDGCHDVHYDNGNDGAIVLNPTNVMSKTLFFRFPTPSF